jgi:DNA ligase (NAD+)
VGSLVHFASRDALDIAGLGDRTAESLVGSGLVQNVADVFKLREEDLLGLERFAALSARNLLGGIERAKHTDLARFLYAVGIPGVGQATARDLADRFGDIHAMAKAGEDELMSVSGIGPTLAHGVAVFFREPVNRAVVDACLARGVTLRAPERRAGAAPLEGKRVAFTGALESITRAEAEERVRALGGHPASDVGKTTDLLVVGANAGSKLDRARQLGVKCITELELLALGE